MYEYEYLYVNSWLNCCLTLASALSTRQWEPGICECHKTCLCIHCTMRTKIPWTCGQWCPLSWHCIKWPYQERQIQQGLPPLNHQQVCVSLDTHVFCPHIRFSQMSTANPSRLLQNYAVLVGDDFIAFSQHLFAILQEFHRTKSPNKQTSHNCTIRQFTIYTEYTTDTNTNNQACPHNIL